MTEAAPAPVPYFTTAELARAAGVTRRTVMHYAEVGLLAPDQVTASGRALYGPYAMRLLRDILDLRALGVPLDEVADMVRLRRATHTVEGVYRHDWTRADIPLSDERLRVVQARLRDLNAAYDRQAENLKRFDRWLTKRFTGAEGWEADPSQEEDEPDLDGDAGRLG